MEIPYGKYLYLYKNDLDFLCFKLNDQLNNLKNSVFFITGGTGIIGKWLLESLVFLNEKYNLNLTLYVLTRSKEKFLASYPLFKKCDSITFFEGDVRDFDVDISSKPSYVIHGAAESASRLTLTDPLKMFEVIIKGTWNILELSKKWKPESILILSSGAVYGRQEKLFLEEIDPGCVSFTDPFSAYAVGKVAGEHLAKLYFHTYKLPVKIARIFALIGPHLPLDAHFAVGNFIRDALKGGPIVIKGDGSPIRSYLYLGDLVIWLLKIMLEGKEGEAYNVGSDKPISIKELAKIVASCARKILQLEREIEVLVEKKEVFSSASDRYVPSIEKAKKELGLKVFTPLEKAIEKTLQFYKFSSL